MSSGKEFLLMNRMVNENESQYVNFCNAVNLLSMAKEDQELTVPVPLLKEITDCMRAKDDEINRLKAALKFYAKDENWNILDHHEGTTFSWVNKLDPRILAEKALAGGKDE